jgi:hypothetical protein
MVHVTCGSISGEMPIEYATEVTAALQKHFFSGCVYILQTSEETMLGKKLVTILTLFFNVYGIIREY